MKTGPQEPKPNFLKPSVILPFVLLILVIIFAAWYGHHSKTNSSATTSSIPAGWTEYNSTQYGFKVAYPGSWGQASVAVTNGKTGRHYQINFIPGSSTKDVNHQVMVSIFMDSTDYNSGACSSAACDKSSAVTAQTIQSNLKVSASPFTRHDRTSYATAMALPSAGIVSLTGVQEVSLPKIGVTGAIGLYNLSGVDATKCPATGFSNNPPCISLSDYATLNKTLKSIQAI